MLGFLFVEFAMHDPENSSFIWLLCQVTMLSISFQSSQHASLSKNMLAQNALHLSFHLTVTAIALS